MNLSFFIARKYFLSGKKKSFINFISVISMLGVAVGLSALIIILSVFNGLEDLNRQIFKSFDPDLKIMPFQSKSFNPEAEFLESVRRIEGIDYITEVYQDKALAKNDKAQTIVDIKGVDSTFKLNREFRNSLVGGQMDIYVNHRPAAFVGAGVYSDLQLTVNDFFNPIQIIYPKNQKLNLLDPQDNLNEISLEISGVFILEQQYDGFVYIPIEEMEDLTGVYDRRTAVEVSLKPGANVKKVKAQIAELLDSETVVKDRDEQNASLLKAIKIEKLFIFIGLIFVVGIAAFNIFYALSMLVIDKKDDIQTMSSLGAEKSLIKKIFYTEGFIISGIGVLVGLIIGLTVTWGQATYGWVGLGVESAIADAYPVRIMASDVIFSVLGIFLITFLASLIPASKAPEFMING